MNLLSQERQHSNIRTDKWPFRVGVAATAVLIATAILGNLLVGIPVGSFKFFWFRLYLPFYTIGFIWFLWTNRHAVHSFPVAVWFFIGFSIYVAASAFWAVNSGGILYGLFALESALFVMMVVFFTAVYRRILVLYLGVIFGLVVLGEVISLWEIVTRSHLWMTRFANPTLPNFVTGELGFIATSAWFFNQNGFGFFFGLALGPLFAWIRWSDRGISVRGLAACVFTLAIILLVNNDSRSALAMVVLAIVGMEILVVLRPWLWARVPSRTGRWKVTAGVFGAAFVSLAIVIVVTNPFVNSSQSLALNWELADESLSVLSRPVEETSSLAVRWQLAVKGVLMMFWSNGIGVGVNSFTVTYNMLWGEPGVSPHNWLTNLLSEFGVIGTGLFLAAYARILYDVTVRYLSINDWVALGLFGTMVSLPIGALGPTSALYSHHSMWVFIGLAAAAAYRSRHTSL